MTDQRTFAGVAWNSKGNLTAAERLRAEMNA